MWWSDNIQHTLYLTLAGGLMGECGGRRGGGRGGGGDSSPSWTAPSPSSPGSTRGGGRGGGGGGEDSVVSGSPPSLCVYTVWELIQNAHHNNTVFKQQIAYAV